MHMHKKRATNMNIETSLCLNCLKPFFNPQPQSGEGNIGMHVVCPSVLSVRPSVSLSIFL